MTLHLRTCSLLMALTLAACHAAPEESAGNHTLIALQSQVIDTAQAGPAPPPELRAQPAAPEESEILLVKYPGPIRAEAQRALRAASQRVYTYLPHHAYLVKVAGGAPRGAAAFPGASWTGLFHPAYKISPEIAAAQASATSEEPQPVMLHVFPDADLAALVRALQGLGVTRVSGARAAALFSRVRLLLTASEISALRVALAGLREVFWIELEGRRALRNDTTIWVCQSGLSGGQATPLFSQGLYGQGQTVAVLDTGIDADACFFRDAAKGLPPQNPCDGGTRVDLGQRKVVAVDFLASAECSGGIANNEWDTQGHGTHVAGTVAGDNPQGPLTHDGGDGMAPGAKLVIQDAGYARDNCGDLPGLGCPVVDLKPIFQQAHDQGARIHSNSWGDNENAKIQNNYTAASQDVDEFMWEHKDHLIVFAAGNSGPSAGSVGSPSTNKNGLSVGASQRAQNANSMASFSSCGQTADGRIKPDLTVPGVGIISAATDRNVASNNCGTAGASGTSMAAPGAAGLAALVRQYYMDGYYPSGAKSPMHGITPSAALVKATLVNSAVNMTSSPAIPANCQGWGRVLLENSLYFAGQTRQLWIKDDAAPFPAGSAGEERSYRFQVSAGEALKVTLAWTDFPSTPAADPNLTNDLDLIVTGPAGPYLGNAFAMGASVAGGSPDRRNTLEQVLLVNPPAGTYTVTVRSFQVPEGPQPFALVLSGRAERLLHPKPGEIE